MCTSTSRLPCPLAQLCCFGLEIGGWLQCLARRILQVQSHYVTLASERQSAANPNLMKRHLPIALSGINTTRRKSARPVAISGTSLVCPVPMILALLPTTFTRLLTTSRLSRSTQQWGEVYCAQYHVCSSIALQRSLRFFALMKIMVRLREVV